MDALDSSIDTKVQSIIKMSGKLYGERAQQLVFQLTQCLTQDVKNYVKVAE